MYRILQKVKRFSISPFLFLVKKKKSLTGTHGVPVCLRKTKMFFFRLAEKRKERRDCYAIPDKP